MEIKVETHLGTVGIFTERYVPGGYHDELSVDKMLEIISEIKGISGLFIPYPTDPLPSDPDKLVKKLDNFNLKVSEIIVDNFTDRKWKNGAFVDYSEKTRKENIKLIKECIDFNKMVNAHSILLWPGHDGFDYPFQVAYSDGWKYLTETLKEIGEYDRKTKIAIEYKSKDPRQRMYVSNVGKEMMLLNDIGLDNIGGVVDTGHAFQAQENIAESLLILDSHNKLFQIHLNENYRDSDPDLIFGTLNFWENLEFFYHLNKTDFKGWLNLDIVSSREDRKKSLKVCTEMIWKYKELADRLINHSNEIDKNLKNFDFLGNLELIKELLF